MKNNIISIGLKAQAVGSGLFSLYFLYSLVRVLQSGKSTAQLIIFFGLLAVCTLALFFATMSEIRQVKKS